MRRDDEWVGSRQTLSAIVAVLVMVWLGVAWAATVGAQDGGGVDNHAGLVVRHGDGRVTYAYVAFEDDELDGIELLRRTGIEAVTIPFGGLGEGVCSLEGEGCGVSECRRLCQTGGSDSPYWRYFGLDAGEGWSPFELGASSATVRDGDVQLWSWSPDEPLIEPVALTDVARFAGFPGGDTDEVRWTATVYPEGMEPEGEDGQPWLAHAAAGGVLLVIGTGSAFAVRRGRASDAGRPRWDAA